MLEGSSILGAAGAGGAAVGVAGPAAVIGAGGSGSALAGLTVMALGDGVVSAMGSGETADIREFSVASADYAEILGPWEARGGEDLGEGAVLGARVRGAQVGAVAVFEGCDAAGDAVTGGYGRPGQRHGVCGFRVH